MLNTDDGLDSQDKQSRDGFALFHTRLPNTATMGATSMMVETARRLVPEGIRQRLLWALRVRRMLVGGSSQRAFRRLEDVPVGAGAAVTPVALRIRALAGRSVSVRPGTTDLTTLIDTFWWAYHLPPETLDRSEMRVIWDLGSNVGFTVAHLAQVCPASHVVGVELDSDNAAMATSNTAPWSDRCTVVQAGIWIEDGTLAYRQDPGQEYASRIEPLIQDASLAPNASAPALSLNTLLRREASPRIDYIKMDIEGAESRVLRENTEWAEAVRAIKVEIHEPYSVASCIADLEALGFDAAPDTKHHACVVGTR